MLDLARARPNLRPTFPKYRRADPHMGGAELDGEREIGAHAHGQQSKTVAAGDFGGERGMRGRRLVEGRRAPQPRDREAGGLPTGPREGGASPPPQPPPPP